MEYVSAYWDLSGQRLTRCKEYGGAIDIRYFPHCRHLETYCMETDGLPVYLENNGDSVIYFTANVGVIELEPWEESFCQKKMQRSFWFERHEYDGQEWQEFKKQPKESDPDIGKKEELKIWFIIRQICTWAMQT